MPILDEIITFDTLREYARGKYWYLASPYTHRDKAVQHQRAQSIREIAAFMMQKGLYVYSPIHACHWAAVHYSLPGDHLWWWEMNRAFIEPSAGIIVTMMIEWENSKGVKAEVELAKDLGREIVFYDPSHQCFLPMSSVAPVGPRWPTITDARRRLA